MTPTPDRWTPIESQARRLLDTQAHMLPMVSLRASDLVDLVDAARRVERLSKGRDAAILDARRLRAVLDRVRPQDVPLEDFIAALSPREGGE